MNFANKCAMTPISGHVIESRLPQTPQQSVNESEILAGVQSSQLFGMVEVDISVTEQWPAHFVHPTMSPHQYFGGNVPSVLYR